MTEEARCPFPHGDEAPPAEAGACPVAGSTWQPEALASALARARQAAPRSHLEPGRAEAMARNVTETRATERRLDEITDLFVRTLGKKLGHGHPLSDRTGIGEFTWTDEALARLEEVPDFCRELTRWRVEWTAHRLGLGTTITPEVMQVKYEMWGRVSHAIRDRHDDGLPWTDEAVERFDRIPDFVKGQVLEAVEGNARRLGATVVDTEVVDRVVQRWRDTGDFHEGLYGFR